MKSFAYGPFGFNRKFNYDKRQINNNKHAQEKLKNNLLNTNKKSFIKKMRSSVVANKTNLNISVNHNEKLIISKSNVLQSFRQPERKKSFDDKILNISKNRKKEHKLKKEEIEQAITRKYSNYLSRNRILNIFKEKYE